LGTIDFLDIAQCKTDFSDRKMPQFCIWMKTGRQYSLGCVKEADATLWAKSITQCIQALVDKSGGKGPALPTSQRPKGKVPKGWPQLTAELETKDVIPIVLRIISFCSQDDLIHCVRLSRFWKIIATEVITNGQDTDSGSDSGEGEDDEGSGEDEEEEGAPPIVIDNGAHIIRAGFVGEEVPKILLSQASGGVLDPKQVAEGKGSSTVQLDSMNHFTDNPATWKLLEKTWRSLFALLKADPTKHRILITQPLMAPKSLVENMQRILFEKFRVPACHVAIAPILTCYGYGKWTGLVVDIGHSSAQVCPIVDGYLKEGSVRRAQHLGGENLTRRMYEFLKFSSISKLPVMEALAIAQGIKEKYCFCPKDFTKDVKDEKYKITYKLPAGETITIQRAIVSVGEMYFDPQKVTGDRDQSVVSIQELVGQVVEASDMDSRQELVSNILLSGGGCLMKNFIERFDLELKLHLPHLADSIKIFADKDCQNGVWRGGAVLAGLDSFQRKWTKREEWAVR
jgi:actin-related protein